MNITITVPTSVLNAVEREFHSIFNRSMTQDELVRFLKLDMESVYVESIREDNAGLNDSLITMFAE
jgi:hypothetical protein